ncbi:hypothetical protein HZB03_01495 [Candidatus Woesearchaeota archaeon]|nr:hypothetical protein [Candidatus Woesearchaeota archaeon]
MNVIVVAVIALIIMVVLAVVFGSRFKLFGAATVSCATKGGQCQEKCGEDDLIHRGTNCEKDFPNKPLCCVPFGSATVKK